MLRIAIFGDICPIENKEPIRLSVDADYYILGNLECALTDQPRPNKKAGPVLFNPTSIAPYLKSVGFNALSLANNHIRDCGNLGVLSTIDACEKVGIRAFGAGDSVSKAEEPLIIEKDDKRVAVLSFAEKEFNYACEGKAGAVAFDPYDN